MNIIYKTVLLLLCTTGMAYAGVSTGLGNTRTAACADAKSSAYDLSDNVSSSCDCSEASGYEGWVCSVDWESRYKRSSYKNSYSDRSSSSDSDDTPSRFQNTTPPGQRFVPIQIPQRPVYGF